MKKTFIFVTAITMVAVMACTVHAKPNGSLGYNCSSCHNGMADQTPPTEPPVVDPPVVDPPVVDPPVVDPPVVDPPVTEPPVVEAPADQLKGVEITTIWDYNIADGQADLSYVFYTVIETDATVNAVDIVTPSETVLQLTQEANVQLDNIVTRFTDEGETFVWELEAKFDNVEDLADYGNGKFIIALVSDEGVTETALKYHTARGKVKPQKRKGNRGGDDDHDDDDHDDDDDDDEEEEEEEDDD